MKYLVPLRVVTPDHRQMVEVTVEVEARTLQEAYQLAVKTAVGRIGEPISNNDSQFQRSLQEIQNHVEICAKCKEDPQLSVHAVITHQLEIASATFRPAR